MSKNKLCKLRILSIISGGFTLGNLLVWVRLNWVHEHQDNTLKGGFYIEIWCCETWNLLVYDRVPQIVCRPPVAEVINP